MMNKLSIDDLFENFSSLENEKESTLLGRTKLFFENVCYYYNEILIKIYNFFNGVKNLFKWFKIIWNDRDYDFYFTLKIIHQKIKNQRMYFESSKYISHKDKKIIKMKYCEYLIERLISDDYYDSDECKRLMVINRKLAYKYENEMRKQDKNLLFKLLNTQIDTWWD